MIRPIIFVGPSLSGHPKPSADDIDYRPPASCGDIVGAVEDGARTIGLIDGSFEHCASTWHKEILWALTKGAVVIGASSMGALRAAELHTLGMHGVGSVFAAYASGRIAADDEVALVHGPEESGYVPLSLPLVDLRATLRWLRRTRQLTPATAASLIAAAQKLYFKDRTIETIVRTAFPSARERRRLSALLADNLVDIKQVDAIRLLRMIARDLRAGPVHFRIGDIRTHYLESMMKRAVRRR